MAAYRSRTEMSSEHLAVGGRPAGQVLTSSIIAGNARRDHAAGMNGITMVTIDDTYIGEEGKVKEGATAYYDMEYSMPEEDEVTVEEEDDVFVIEYSNPEEDGQSYQFTMSVDRSLPSKKIVKHPISLSGAPRPIAPRPSAPRPPAPRPVSQTFTEPGKPKKMKWVKEDSDVREKLMSNKSVLELGEDYDAVLKMNDGKSLVCSLCPPPGRRFKRGSGLAVHLKTMHQFEGKKTFFCTWCQQYVRTQVILDDHTKRHTNAETVFTCKLCLVKMENNPEGEGKVFRGSRWGMKRHMKNDHPGVIPPCDICHKNFKIIDSYLAHQFRHIGVTPWHCAKCQIYEMTERGLQVHIRNHDMPKKTRQTPEGSSLLKPGGRSLQTPEERSLQTPEGRSLQTPEGSSLQTPEERSLQTPEGSSLQTPEGSSLQTPEERSLQTPEGRSLQMPGGSSLQTPEGSSLQTPEGRSLQMPGGSFLQTPEERSLQTPEGRSLQTPEERSLQTPEGRSLQTPEGRSLQTPEGRSLQTPEERSLQTPEERSLQTPEGRSLRTPGGRSLQTPEGSSLQTPEGRSLQTPEGRSLQTPEERSLQTPEGRSLRTPGGRSLRTPGGSSLQMPEGRSLQTPEGNSPQTPEGRSLQTPGGSSLQTPEGRSLQTPEGSSPQTPEGCSLQMPEVPAVVDNPATDGCGI